jgi:hypothetical protein
MDMMGHAFCRSNDVRKPGMAAWCLQVASHWVPPPSDRMARASFDSALHWWHTTIRAPCIDLLMGGVLGEGRGKGWQRLRE